MNFAQLALICAVAILGPLLSLQKFMRMPVVIGELLVGVALGATGLGVLHAQDPTFTFLGEGVGFALVMLIAGSHVPLRTAGLRGGLRAGALRALGCGVLAVPAGLGIAHLFGTGNGLLYAVLLASSSAAIVMPTLSGLPLAGPETVAMLAQIAIADAACVVLLPLAVDPTQAPARALGALVVLAGAGLAYVFLRWAQDTGRRRRVHRLSADRGLALELRTALTMLFALAAVAQLLGVSVMLAGFGIGLALAAVGEPRRLANQLFALAEGLFAPLFFVWLGASLDLRAAWAQPHLVLLGLVLGLAAAAVHGATAVAGQPLPFAATTCAQLGVPVAAATLGRAEGVLAPGEDAALLIGALVTIVLVAVLSGAVERRARATASSGPAGAVAS